MKTHEGNQLIAEFMGFTPRTDLHTEGALMMQAPRIGNETHSPCYIVNKEDDVHDEFLELKYNSDWNWLMPALDKIRNSTNWANSDYSNSNLIAYKVDIGFHSSSFYCNIHKHWWENNYPEEEFICGRRDTTTLIEVTWKAVVQFIEWYNKNKTK